VNEPPKDTPRGSGTAVRPCRLGAGRRKGGSGRVARGTRGRLILDDDRVAMARRKGSAPSSVLDTDIVALSAVPPLVARRRQRGLSVTLAKLLPPALVMIAGPQILLRPSSWRPPPNWRRNSAAFVVGAGAAITAPSRSHSSRVMGHPTSSSSLIKSSGRLWRRARRSGAETRSATSL